MQDDNISKTMHYDRAEAQRVIEAYREIFPRITPELANYWDTARTRPWSYLTSDFHRATLSKYETFSATVEKLDDEAQKPGVIISAPELAAHMVSLCRQHDLGFRAMLIKSSDS